jgi:hypothetical protein
MLGLTLSKAKYRFFRVEFLSKNSYGAIWNKGIVDQDLAYSIGILEENKHEVLPNVFFSSVSRILRFLCDIQATFLKFPVFWVPV